MFGRRLLSTCNNTMQQHSVWLQVARISVRALRGLPENALQMLMGISFSHLPRREDLILSETPNSMSNVCIIAAQHICTRHLNTERGNIYALRCVNSVSWHSLATGRKCTQPRAHLIAQFCVIPIVIFCQTH